MIVKNLKSGLKKLIAEDNKIIVSTSIDENNEYVVKAKEVYLPNNSNIQDFMEIDM